jgi:hypothetical protein
MPIKPENRHLYAKDWAWIRMEILERAGYCCEFCGVQDRSWGWRDKAGQFQYATPSVLKAAGFTKPPFSIRSLEGNLLRIIEIVLTVAHLDHNPEHNDPSNLKALCQRCHLNHDRRHHIKNRYGPKPGQLRLAGVS